MKIAQFFRLSAVFLLLIGCTSKKETSLEPFDDLAKYQAYISEITHGIISTKSDVRVVLQKPIPSWENGGGLDNDLLLVSPKVKGKVVSLNNRTIAFVPEKGFEQDTEYTFTLAVKEIIDEVPKELRNMVFGIKTQKQQFNLYTEPLQSYSKELQYINGQVRSADIMPLSVLKELVSVTHEGKAVKVIFDETIKEGTQFYFKIDSIQRYIEDTSLEISWDGAKRAIESSGKQAIQIPGKNNFTVMEAIVHIGEGQMVSINFSDPIKKGQNLKGLVVLEGATDPKFSIDGNTLKVYPDQEIKGASKLEVFEGIESADGYKLKSKYEERVAFEQIKPEVRFLTNGTILPASNNLKINFETVNLNAVDVTVLKIYENNILQFL